MLECCAYVSAVCLQMDTRGGNIDERIKKLDAELIKNREAIKKLRPGPAQVGVAFLTAP